MNLAQLRVMLELWITCYAGAMTNMQMTMTNAPTCRKCGREVWNISLPCPYCPKPMSLGLNHVPLAKEQSN